MRCHVLCQSLHWLPLSHRIKFKILTITYKAIHNLAPSYISNLVTKYQPNRSLRSSQDLLLSNSLVTSSHARLQDFSRASPHPVECSTPICPIFSYFIHFQTIPENSSLQRSLSGPHLTTVHLSSQSAHHPQLLPLVSLDLPS